MNRLDVYRNNEDLLDSFDSRLRLVNWTIQSFNEDDLFVTLNCPLIDKLDTFIFSKLSSINNRVFIRNESNLYRIAVLVKLPQPHIHLLIKNVKFVHKDYKDFRDLVYKKFKRSLPDENAIDIQKIGKNVSARVKYILLKQKKCKVDFRSMYLMPYDEIKVAA